MKLRNKLLLVVAILFFCMIFMMYVLPTIFIRKDVFKAAEKIHELLIEDRDELAVSQSKWLSDTVDRTVQNIDAILLMLYQQKDLHEKLKFSSSELDVWTSAARLLGFDPEIDLIQVHDLKQNKSAVITPHAATLYSVMVTPQRSGQMGFTLIESQKKQGRLYYGLPLPKNYQTEEGITLYALVDPEHLSLEKAEIQKELENLPETKSPEQDVKQLDLENGTNSNAYYWATKVSLVKILTPLFVEGFLLGETRYMVPEGIIRVDANQKGFGILSKELFRTSPIFDDQAHYEKHAPKKDSLPLARGSALITDAQTNQAYIGNTLLLGDSYLTIGNAFSHLGTRLALASNKTILLKIGDNFWMGFEGTGEQLSKDEIRQFLQQGLEGQKQGMVTLEKESFFYNQIASLFNGKFTVYDLNPIAGEKTILGTLTELEEQLSERITLQLLLISIATMLLVLLIVARIIWSIISPISKLADATESVAAGKYEDVHLPDVGNRKDEVATLTHSFEEMVIGLQDREKIRGVLDKVVSKDVAAEILRTKIHLGGEDRIVTMLFSDIRNFSELTAEMPPQETIQLLNECMTLISRVIEGEGGVIDKYVGDEVMALFGAPTTHPEHALRAVSTAMLMIETLKNWNETRVSKGLRAVEMGIGIHTGLVVVGNMGAEDRLNYTVLGANVNLAARLCETALSNQLIISEGTLAEPKVADSFYVKPLNPVSLKGFAEPVKIFEVTGFKWT